MKKNIIFLSLLVIVLTFPFTECSIPGEGKQAVNTNTIEETEELNLSDNNLKRAPTQAPAVYESKVGGPYPSLVWTGSNYGVTWSTGGSVNFAKMYANGIKIDSDIIIDSNQSDSISTAWCYSTSQFGVAWLDGLNSEVHFARLNSNGNKISGSEVKISSFGYYSRSPSIVCTGYEYCIAWIDTDNDGNYAIYYRILDRYGNKLTGERRVSIKTYDNANSKNPCLAYDSRHNEFGIVWESNNNSHGTYEIYFNRIMAYGDSGDSSIWKDAFLYYDDPVRISNYNDADSVHPSLTYNGKDKCYGLAWEDYRNGTCEVYFSAVDWGGGSSTSDTRISVNDDTDSKYPSVVWNNKRNEFGIAWEDGDNIKFGRIGTDGNLITRKTILTNKENPSLVWAGSNYALAYNGNFIRFDEDGNKIAIGGLNGILTGSQNGYYYIRNKEYETYLSDIASSSLALRQYYNDHKNEQQWELQDSNNDGCFKIKNKATGRYITGYLSGGNPSSLLGTVTSGGDLHSWWLYPYDDNGSYMLRVEEDTSYRIYADDATTPKLRSNAYYSTPKKWQLIYAGD